MRNLLRKIIGVVCLFTIVGSLAAQEIRSAYFIKNAPVRNSLNPALRPASGYITIPFIVVGSLGASFTTNGVSLDDFFYPSNGDLVTFLDESVDANDFLGKLKNNNQFNASASIDILSAGWFHQDNFWTVALSAKSFENIQIPKSLFEFAKLGTGGSSHYDFSDISIRSNNYVEASVGLSKPINSKLTVGAKFKLLLGIANLKTTFDKLEADLDDNEWIITSSGSFDASMKGLSPQLSEDNQGNSYISGFDISSAPISGFGAAIDLGVDYKFADNISFSGSLLNLGFIHWGARNSIRGEVDNQFAYDGFQINSGNDPNIPSLESQITELKDDLLNLFHFQPVDGISRYTSTVPTINAGGEYRILDNVLGFGLLSSTMFFKPNIYSEITLSANYSPIKWFDATLSYSALHSKFNTFGLSLNFSTSWINCFIGTDYILTRVTPQYIPVDANAANFYMGVSIPLAYSKKNNKKSDEFQSLFNQ